jgi:hypothetical protein
VRKKSSYRPKGVLINPLAYVLESIKPVTMHDSYLLDLKIKNHGAMTSLTQGNATIKDIDVLISVANMVEALCMLGFGTEYVAVSKAGSDALHFVGSRGAVTGKFILKAEEMNAMNELMELHDQQMEIIVVKDIERANAVIYEMRRQRKMRSMTRTQT